METQNENIVMLNPGELFDHPLENEVYGDVVVDDDFVNSIVQLGIITPLTVCVMWGDQYTIVSGHRRNKGAIIAGLESVPCIIREYENDEEMNLHFLASNKNREKSTRQRVNEFLKYKSELSKIGKTLMCKELKPFKDSSCDVARADENGQIFEREMEKYLNTKGAEIEDDEPFDYKQIIAEKTGFSSYYQRLATVVYDDTYIQNRSEKLTGVVSPKDLVELDKAIEETRAKVNTEEMTLKEAHDVLQAMFKDLETKASKKAKKAAPKPKKEIKTKVYVANIPSMETFGFSADLYEKEKATIVESLSLNTENIELVFPDMAMQTEPVRNRISLLFSCEKVVYADKEMFDDASYLYELEDELIQRLKIPVMTI